MSKSTVTRASCRGAPPDKDPASCSDLVILEPGSALARLDPGSFSSAATAMFPNRVTANREPSPTDANFLNRCQPSAATAFFLLAFNAFPFMWFIPIINAFEVNEHRWFSSVLSTRTLPYTEAQPG